MGTKGDGWFSNERIYKKVGDLKCHDGYTPDWNLLTGQARRGGTDDDTGQQSVRLNLWERQHIITVAIAERLEEAAHGMKQRILGGAFQAGAEWTHSQECRELLGGLLETLIAELRAFEELSEMPEQDLVPDTAVR